MTARMGTALALARRLNAGELPASDVLTDLGLEYGEDYYGEDLGNDFNDVDDPSNDVIDLCWHEGAHTQVRRLSRTAKWQVEVMRRYNEDGSEAP